MTPRSPLFARVAVTLASRMVPPALRVRWLAEWRSELWHEAGYLESVGWGRVRRTAHLTRAAMGAWPDARAFGRLHPTPSRRASPHQEIVMQFVREVRYGVRSLLRSPVFTVVAVATLALGIGANTAIFSVVNGVLVQPLPYPNADELVLLTHRAPGLGSSDRWGLSEKNYFHYGEHVPGLAAIAVTRGYGADLVSDGQAEQVRGVSASASIFRTLGATPHLGRLFTEGDDVPGAASVVVLGFEFWQQRYGADSSIVGQSVDLSGLSREVVGVVERGIHLPRAKVDIWSPVRLDPLRDAQNNHVYSGYARMIPGMDVETLQRQMGAEVGRFAELYPTAYSPDFMDRSDFSIEVTPLHREVVGDVSAVLWILLGAVSLVLVIACANVANLFLVRAEGRRREVALREAIGASRGDLARYFLAESLVLAATGGIVGILIAQAGVGALIGAAPESLPRLDEVGLDGTTLLFALGVTLATGIVFGAFPLLRRDRGAMAVLRDGGRGASVGRPRHRFRQGLIVIQVGMALTLLVAAGVMFESFSQLRAVDPGFRPDGALAVNVSLPFNAYRERESMYPFYRQLISESAELPGVQYAGAATGLPLEGGLGCIATWVREGPGANAPQPPCVPIAFVVGNYFEAMQIPIIRGRSPDLSDTDRRTGAVVVSSVLADQLWPGEDPLGKALRIAGRDGRDFQVVGVAGPVHSAGLEEPPPEIAYFPVIGFENDSYFGPINSVKLVVRHETNDRGALVGSIRGIANGLDSRVPIANARTLQEILDGATLQSSVAMVLIGLAAGIALLLGTVGIYGVISYVVSGRTVEVGLRIALGARAGEVRRMVLGESMRLVALGLVVGLGGAWMLQRAMASTLFGIDASNPTTMVLSVVALTVVGFLASYVPARRASRIDPMVALRADG